MQLRIARVCLDCEEIHDGQTCPVCASESFAFISRWVPAPERRHRPPRIVSPDADTYAQIMHPRARSLRERVVRSAMGIVAVTVAGWLWRNSRAAIDRFGTTKRSPRRRVHRGKGMGALST